jgi:hypothetical protein
MSLVDKCLESFFYAILLGSSFGQIIWENGEVNAEPPARFRAQ